MKEDIADKEESINIFNSATEDIILWIEPWCLEFTMTTEDVFTIIGTGPRRGRFEVGYSEKQITVWAWPGSKIKVIKNDKEVEAIEDLLRVPPIPGWEDLFETNHFKRKNN